MRSEDVSLCTQEDIGEKENEVCRLTVLISTAAGSDCERKNGQGITTRQENGLQRI